MFAAERKRATWTRRCEEKLPKALSRLSYQVKDSEKFGLVIQRAEHRDTQAIHAKLDEILHALGDARNEITRMDEEEPEEIERQRQHMRKDD